MPEQLVTILPPLEAGASSLLQVEDIRREAGETEEQYLKRLLPRLCWENEDFEGGCTTFFNPDPETIGVVEARGVSPRCGSVIFG